MQLSRFVFTVAGALAGVAVSRLADWTYQLGLSETAVIIIFIILGASIGYVLGGIVGRELARLYAVMEEHLAEYATTDVLLGTAGLLVGLLVALILSVPLRVVLHAPVWTFLAMLLLFGVCAYGGMRIALVKRREVRVVFGRLNAEEAEAYRAPVKYLDTSAVIDGRFVELRRAGLLEGTMRVPRFVLGELQTLADSADETKRARGKRGLDLLEAVAESGHAPEVFQIDYADVPDVDGKLLRLAADAGGTIVTCDGNLTKVGRLQGLSLVNLNEIAAAMKPAYLPGETLRLSIVREGKEAEQGVGYLEDGTMVVVADGRRHIGEMTDAEVTSVLQTAVGRMVFARVKAAS